jgi:hypothetical protein
MERKARFTWLQILLYTGTFVGVTVIVQRTLRYVCNNWIPFDCTYYWPVSVFNFRIPSLVDMLTAAAVVAAFYFIARFLEARRYDLRFVAASGVLLIAALTLAQGYDVGYVAPIAGDAQTGVLVTNSTEGQEYYHDALKVSDPIDFLQRYNELQPTLNRHTHTHPPGAVLLFYFLNRLFPSPGLIALFIMAISTVASAFFVQRLVRAELSDETANYTAFLFVLLPAVQIYYLATLDAMIVALLTGTLYLFCFGKGRAAVAGAIAMLCTSFMLTFVSLFILPVIVGFELLVKRSIKRSVIVIGGVLAFHVLMYAISGYNAWTSFRTASRYENPQGFMLFVDPANYAFTRLEDVAEIMFFLGPFLLVLMARGLRSNVMLRPLSEIGEMAKRPLIVLAVLGCISLLSMYAVGAWRTGETARACAWIYPYLLFPVSYFLEEHGDARVRMQLAALVFAQAVGMQLFGNYFW